MKKQLNRRKFLTVSGAGSGFLISRAVQPPSLPAESSAQAPAYQSFSSADGKLLEVLSFVILAPQGNQPTPQQVNLLSYLDQQYASPSKSGHLRRALEGIRQEVKLRFGSKQDFADLKEGQQEEILSLMEENRGQAGVWKSVSSREFFQEIRSHIVDGYYSNPLVFKAIGYGGRAQFIGYPDYNKWPVEEDSSSTRESR
ncbi:gluconate 2-dehydrogenase subunit 3 family protein [Acidobacteria bacterium AH-259-D05]|nr:gluconate 2-dehydrogenase subunit 3 family protein [Acidobacteria bacterium AH-259-D05]